MCDLTETLGDVFGAIDSANASDPNRLGDEPLARTQGQRASAWLDRLAPHASPELQVAVRAHHLRRWEVARTDYPDGRSGYLRWRRENKAHQAESAAAILAEAAWPPDSIDRVRELLGRTKLRSDDETQTLEDAACLVFLETQFADMVERTDHDHMVSIVAKTLRKMSTAAIQEAGTLPLDARGRAVIADAASLEAGDA